MFPDGIVYIFSYSGAGISEVTDRVVNQFLTEMDGVEGALSNLFILAASRYDHISDQHSHPEMIDSAIVRPGRIDRHLFCGLPNRRERLDVPLLMWVYFPRSSHCFSLGE